jgi:hypothetical protein
MGKIRPKAIFGQGAQVATEYLTLIGILLVIIAIFSAYAFFMYNEATANAQVQSSLRELKSAVNTVYSLGEGNTLIAQITLPNNVISMYAQGKAIYLISSGVGGNSEDFVEVDSNVSGSLPNNQGTYDIVVSNVNGAVTLNVS